MNNKSLLALLGFTALTTGCIEIQSDCDEVVLSMEDLSEVQRVVLDVDAGSTVVIGGETDEVHVMREWRYTERAPTMSIEVQGEDLVITARCDDKQFMCDTRHELHVPASLALLADLGSGGLDVSGLDASVTADMGSGGIVATDLAGGLSASLGSGGVEMLEISGALLLDLGSGGVDGAGLRAEEAVVSVGSGGVDLRFAEPPALVDVSAGSGGIDLLVPEGVYNLQLDVGSGGLEIRGLENDPSAEASIFASAGSGGVSVVGFSPEPVEETDDAPDEGADQGEGEGEGEGEE